MKFASMAKYALVSAGLILGLNMVTASKASAAEVCKVDCAKLQLEYNKLVAKYGVNNKLVKLAKAYLDKVCPPAPSETRIYECRVVDTSGAVNVALGLDGAGMLVNVQSPSKTVCTTQTACQSIVSTKFSVLGVIASARCAAGSTDATISRLSDADMQTKINQLP